MSKRIYIFGAVYLAFSLSFAWFNRGQIQMFDLRLIYEPQEALFTLLNLSAADQARFTFWTLADILICIPSYTGIYWYLAQWQRMNQKIVFQVPMGVMISADLIETVAELLGTHKIGLWNGLVPQLMSIATPTKWGACFLVSASITWQMILSWKKKL